MHTFIEPKAFPSPLASEVQKVAFKLMTNEDFPHAGSFQVLMQDEVLEIPDRLYYQAHRLEREVEGSGQPHLIAACLGTRHHDGFVRERCLERLLPVAAPWVVPYVIALLGEYVLPIIRIIEAHCRSDDLTPYGEFLAKNEPYLLKTERRVVSYWDAYHRRFYPKREDYPGFLAMHALKRATAEHRARTRQMQSADR